MSSFGWGQRQCLGMNVTQDELVVACGALMWCFDLGRTVDPESGEEVEVPLDKTNSLLIIKPDPFTMKFTVRSEARRKEAIRLWRESEARDVKERRDFLIANGKDVLVDEEADEDAKSVSSEASVVELVAEALKGKVDDEADEKVPWVTTVEVKA